MTTSLATWSNGLFAAALLTYTLGMLAFAVDLAFGRRRSVTAGAEASRQRTAAHVREVELVIVGASPARLDLPPALPPQPSALTISDDRGTPAARRDTARVAVAVTGIGWLIHLGEVITRGLAAGRVPWGNMYEFSSAVSLVAIGLFLALAARGIATDVGVYVMVPAICYLGLAGTVLYTRAAPLQPVLNSYWLKIHVVAAITATGTFMVGGVVTLLLLLRRRIDRRPTPAAASDAPGGMLRRLPAAAALDQLERRIITLAFPIWTFAVIAGAIWAESAWGRYWGWDPKETWSFITWVLYACYLHARATMSWRRAAPFFALAGFTALVFNYYVVNLVVNGLHSYAGV